MLKRRPQRISTHTHVSDGEPREQDRDSQPISPEAKEPMKRPEVVSRPKIHAACAGILDRKRPNGNRQRHKKRDRRGEPEHDGAGSAWAAAEIQRMLIMQAAE